MDTTEQAERAEQLATRLRELAAEALALAGALAAGSEVERADPYLPDIEPLGAVRVRAYLRHAGRPMSRRDVFARFRGEPWCHRVTSLDGVLRWLEDRGEIEYERSGTPASWWVTLR